MVESELILAKATAAFLRAEKDYRAAMLECGNLIHSFIVAHLERGAAMKERERQSQGYTRAHAVELVAESFGVDTHRVHTVLLSSMAVVLLSDSGEIGGLGLRSLYYFGVLIQRKTCGENISKYGTDGTSPTELEEWIVKPGLEVAAVELFRKAVSEGWGQDRSEVECRKLLHTVDHPRAKKRNASFAKEHRSYSNEEDDEPSSATINPAVSSPGDIAEYCLGLIRKSADPWQVAQRLLAELAKIPKPRMRMLV